MLIIYIHKCNLFNLKSLSYYLQGGITLTPSGDIRFLHHTPAFILEEFKLNFINSPPETF